MVPNLLFEMFKIQRSVIYQIVCILEGKYISVLKISYGHCHWGQDCPLCIRKALSGKVLINCFLDICISVVYWIVCIFQVKSYIGVNLSQNAILIGSGRLQIILLQEHSWSIHLWVTFNCCISNCIYFLWSLWWSLTT